jgi:hypothetical protein
MFVSVLGPSSNLPFRRSDILATHTKRFLLSEGLGAKLGPLKAQLEYILLSSDSKNGSLIERHCFQIPKVFVSVVMLSICLKA